MWGMNIQVITILSKFLAAIFGPVAYIALWQSGIIAPFSPIALIVALAMTVVFASATALGVRSTLNGEGFIHEVGFAIYERGIDCFTIIENGKFIAFNDAVLKKLGAQSRKQVADLSPADTAPEYQPDGRRSDEKAREMMAAALKNGTHRFEWTHRRLNGDLTHSQVTLIPLTIQNRHILISHWWDNNELVATRAAEQAAEKARREMMLQTADDFEHSVKGVVATVSAAATEMRSNAQSMAAIAEQTNHQSTAVAAAAEQASTNVQTVASAAEELNASIVEINRQIGDSLKVATACTEEAEKTSEVMQGLGKAAEEIGNVVKLIEGIASQVNLLALNTTIEAARAGEAGKGFAVVAGEVKSLANQAGNAANDIARQIGEVQGQTKKAVEAIASITDTVKRVNEISTAIASAVEEQGAATREIARNVQQASQGTDEVTRNITGVTRAASETGSAASQVLDAAKRLSKESETLRHVVDTFISKIRTG